MAYVYFLYSEKDNNWYVGCTNNTVEQRFEAHKNGTVKSTKHRRPLSIAYFEKVETLSTARRREWFLKQKDGIAEKSRIKSHLIDNKDQWPIEGPIAEVGGPTVMEVDMMLDMIGQKEQVVVAMATQGLLMKAVKSIIAK